MKVDVRCTGCAWVQEGVDNYDYVGSPAHHVVKLDRGGFVPRADDRQCTGTWRAVDAAEKLAPSKCDTCGRLSQLVPSLLGKYPCGYCGGAVRLVDAAEKPKAADDSFLGTSIGDMANPQHFTDLQRQQVAMYRPGNPPPQQGQPAEMSLANAQAAHEAQREAPVDMVPRAKLLAAEEQCRNYEDQVASERRKRVACELELKDLRDQRRDLEDSNRKLVARLAQNPKGGW